MASADVESAPASDQLDLKMQDTHEDTPHPPASLVQSRIEVPESLFQEVILVATLCMAQLLNQAGLGMALFPLHIIGDSFGTKDPGQLSWFISSYSLTVGTFILPAGRLGDLYGHKNLFIVGSIWYGIWSILAGFSVYSNLIFFDICRALQGIGPALMLPNAVAILGRAYKPGRRQEMVFSLFGATAPSGSIIGAVFAGIFAQLVWWPWAFWVMGIVCVLLAVISYFVIPRAPGPDLDDDATGTASRIDAAGAITGVIGLVLVNFSFNQAPIVGWETPYVYALLVIGALFLAAFAVIELRAKFPLVPIAYMNSHTGFVLACIALGWSSFGIWVYYLLQIQLVLRDESSLLVTAHMSPVTISGLCAALATGILLHRLSASVVMSIAMAAFLAGNILVATMPVDQTYWAQTFLATLVTPFGMDMSFPAATIILSNALPREHQGLAGSLVNTVLNYSISLGLGFAGTIEVHVDDHGSNILKGYRGALYMGVGLAGLGVVVSALFILSSKRKTAKEKESKKTRCAIERGVSGWEGMKPRL